MRAILLAFVLIAFQSATAQDVTPPADVLGFNIGDDYQLATYDQMYDYWQLLASESDRMTVEDIGMTEEGRPQIMAVITSPNNRANLEGYQDIARQLALAEGLSDETARTFAEAGKAIVWIDGGLHATEVLGAQQLMETVYQLVSMDDPETLRFLEDVIILAVHANPDGMELVSNWYMREENPEDRRSGGIPVLYQKYVGHDNNRDFYMSTQAESINMNRILYREWFPQIVYNHHQTGPAGTVMFAPPFRDPFNYNYHPLVPLSIEAVGTAMHSRFVREGKGGTTMRSGASYSTWWNGGLRTTPYFHNQIGLLTETIGNPTPMEIPLILSRQLPKNDIPMPVEPQKWHFRQSVDYSVTANRAVLNYASRNRVDLLYNIYVMGRDNIAKGQQDTWRTDPNVISAADQAAREMGGSQGRRGIPTEIFDEVFRDPDLRDPRGYIIPADQADFPTATKFVNTLIKNGISVHRATADFDVAGTSYDAGSYVVMTGQAFRPFVLDMFEPQVHPNDFAYPGGPPVSPYDNTGWTVAFQMGIDFDRVLDGFEGPFERIEGFASPAGGAVTGARNPNGYLFSAETNDSFLAMNRLLDSGARVYRLPSGSGNWGPGTFYVASSGAVRSQVQDMATELGLQFEGTSRRPGNDAVAMRKARVGLWDRYGGSMPSGWARWVLEQFEFDYELVFPKQLDAGDLADDYDVLVFVNGAIPSGDGGGFGGFRRAEDSIPEEYRDRLGSVTVESTVPQLEEFLEAGGDIITIGHSTALGRHLDLPMDNWLVDHENVGLSRDEYFVPGSIVRINVDNTQPVAWGLPSRLDVHFNNSPVFELGDGLTQLGWFSDRQPLRSGWAWGQHYLNGGTTMAQAQVGQGTLYLFGPEVIRRGQPHGTFKLLFNGIAHAGLDVPMTESEASDD
ncbi:MAG: peptidase [Rhodothermales bacterium]|nr:peptidase [Rhodothermales bacterium]